MLFALLAFLVHLRGLRGRPTVVAFVLSGVLLGIATGIRISFVLLLPPFAAAAVITQRRVFPRQVMWFIAGFGLAVLPALALFATDPAAAWFCNIRYAALNTAFRHEHNYPRAMDLPSKLAFFFKLMTQHPENGLLLLLCGWLLLPPLRTSSSDAASGRAVRFTALVLPFLFAGALLPTPAWLQYFYAIVPFLVLGTFFGLARLSPEQARRSGRLYGLGAVVLLVVLLGLDKYPHVRGTCEPAAWFPMQVHRAGKLLARTCGEGPVLTLAPTYPLEGGLRIYPALATGPFAWRTAHLASPWERRRFGMAGAGELDELVAAGPPSAIALGFEKEEQALRAYATGNGFQPVPFFDGRTVYLPPARR
jgi:4-amino-4-deoxy-L-arabinose transferase-like glycosyltransferase